MLDSFSRFDTTPAACRVHRAAKQPSATFELVIFPSVSKALSSPAGPMHTSRPASSTSATDDDVSAGTRVLYCSTVVL